MSGASFPRESRGLQGLWSLCQVHFAGGQAGLAPMSRGQGLPGGLGAPSRSSSVTPRGCGPAPGPGCGREPPGAGGVGALLVRACTLGSVCACECVSMCVALCPSALCVAHLLH